MMTLIKRLRALFSGDALSSAPLMSPATIDRIGAEKSAVTRSENLLPLMPVSELSRSSEPLPNWITDEESLRDEGVLFGLSEAPADGKVAEIKAAFAQQAAALDEAIEQHNEKIGELNLLIEQRGNQIKALRDQAVTLRNSLPLPTNLIRTIVSLLLSVVMCVGNFFLIDVTLQPTFSNHWIAVGVFMAGMFNLFGRLSFFYDTETRLSTRRIVEEVGLPLATSLFVLTQALQTQSIAAAAGLFVFVFFLFLLSGKLLLSTLTALQNDLNAMATNRQLIIDKEQSLPVWESAIAQLEREVDTIRMQRWPVVTSLNQIEAKVNQLNAQRDRLVNLFLSEFELARSLRDRLTEQQRKLLMNYE